MSSNKYASTTIISKFTILALTLALGSSCTDADADDVDAGSGADASEPMVDAEQPLDPILDSCDTQVVTPSGTLCALQPSRLDQDARDIYGSDTIPDTLVGFGFHVVGIPTNYNPDKGLWIHFGGTYGRPYDQELETYASQLWLNEILAEGYTVIQPAYNNRDSVNDSCKAPNPGIDRDNCAGEIREEVLTGVDLSPYRTTPQPDSVDQRVKVLLSHIRSHSGVSLPEEIDVENLDWSKISVSGHSQGGNLAYYVAHRRGVRFACMLASPFDVADSVNPSGLPIADWFKEGTSLTPAAQMGQMLTSEDDNAGPFRAGGAFIGLTAGEQSFEVSLPPYFNSEGEEINGHAAPLAAPSLQSFRAQACFH